MIERIFLWVFTKFLSGKYELEFINNAPGNQMWRIGKGFNEYRWFARLDWGSKGWRITERVDYCKEYFERVYPQLDEDSKSICNKHMEDLMEEARLDQNIPMTTITRCGQILLERKDLFLRLWVLGQRLLREK